MGSEESEGLQCGVIGDIKEGTEKPAGWCRDREGIRAEEEAKDFDRQ